MEKGGDAALVCVDLDITLTLLSWGEGWGEGVGG